MFIAHLPAGYLVASASKSQASAQNRKLVFWCILIGSILPDLDMFYFYLIDGRQTNHHLYWTHLPAFWALLLGAISIGALLLAKKRLARAILFLFAGTMLHLLLDTLVGGIAWLYPLKADLIYFIEVPATRSWWVWNFVLHWTFLVEISIYTAAATLWICRRRKLSTNHSKL